MTPHLYTPRLVLRPFTLADAAHVQELAGDKRVAATTVMIPHPYPDGAAEAWINTHAPAAEQGRNFTFAITLAGTRTPRRELDPTDTGHLIGAIDLEECPDSPTDAVLGFWIGVPYWNKGFATEAAASVLTFGFNRRRYTRIVAFHMDTNPASGRVQEKIGMIRQPGSRPSEKWNQPITLIDYTLTREAWSRRQIIHRWKPAAPRTIVTALA